MSKTPRTVIRMGASRFDISLLGSDRINLLAVPREDGTVTPASRYELSQAAQAICNVHGIKGPKAKPQRRAPRPYLGKKPSRRHSDNRVAA